MSDLEALKALSDDAWPGPWHVDPHGLQSIYAGTGNYVGSITPYSAAFACAAVNYVRDLIAAALAGQRPSDQGERDES